jgi:hypothetical protein
MRRKKRLHTYYINFFALCVLRGRKIYTQNSPESSFGGRRSNLTPFYTRLGLVASLSSATPRATLFCSQPPHQFSVLFRRQPAASLVQQLSTCVLVACSRMPVTCPYKLFLPFCLFFFAFQQCYTERERCAKCLALAPRQQTTAALMWRRIGICSLSRLQCFNLVIQAE